MTNEKYYKIPLTARIVSANGVSLIEILHQKYPELYDREMDRITLTYGIGPKTKNPEILERIYKDKEETSQLYREMGVPEHIIAIKNPLSSELTVYGTETKLETIGNYPFEQQEISVSGAAEYMANAAYDYADFIQTYFEKPKQKKIQ